MCYFDSILHSRSLTSAPIYLWRLKLRSDEYEALKATLQAGANRSSFSGLEREAALYYAEWWRREYNGGYATTEEIYQTISDRGSAEEFYQAAKKGIERLRLPVVVTTGQQRQRINFKYSLLYHGGLPMNYIENEIKKQRGGSKWDRFFRDLYWNEEDYTEISEEIGIIAGLSPSVREFCKTLQQAEDISEAPFSPNTRWWDVVQKNFELEKKARKAKDPFLFKWIIEMRDGEKKEINLRYHISGPRYLSPEFIETHALDGRNFVSIGVSIDGEWHPLAEYNKTNDKFYSRRSVDHSGKCGEGESISILLDETSEPLTHRFLEFSDPKLMCHIEGTDNSFALCDVKRLSETDCRIIASDDWDCDGVDSERYFIASTPVKVFFIEKDKYPITLRSKETSQEKTFDPQKPLLWTAMDESRCLNIGIATKERLFNAPDGVLFYEGKGDKVGTESVSVLYAEGRRSRRWGEVPRFGLIKARLKKTETESVEAVNFINVGDLSVKIVSSTRDTCTLSINWNYGEIQSDVADFINDRWIINKNRLPDGRTAKFVLSPRRGSGEEFAITLIPPFYDFGIYDFKGRRLESGAIIPIAYLYSFRYYMRMRDRLSVTPGDHGDELKYRYTEDDNRKCVAVREELLGTTTCTGTIPYEGRLASLFMDGSNTIYELLAKTTDPLPEARATIRIETNGNRYFFYFQDYPYHLKYENNNIIVLNYRTLPGYNGDLYALPFSNPESEPIRLNKAGDNVYTLPATIDTSDISWLIYGDTKGYVLPLSVFPGHEISDEERSLSRGGLAEKLKCELKKSKLFSEVWRRALAWFRIIQDGRIPASSVLELVSIADDRELLELFAFHLFLKSASSEEIDEVIRASMLEFQQQLSFLWKWAGESSLNRERINELYADYPDVFTAYYKKWVKTTKQDDMDTMLDYLLDMSHHIPECLNHVIIDFHRWLSNIKTDGIPEQRLLHPDINNNGGDEVLSDEVQEIFQQVRKMSPRIARIAGVDEGWIAERHYLSDMFSTMNFGEFGSDERKKTELRKTIIYGLKFKYNDEI